jgi:hypothetical protein
MLFLSSGKKALAKRNGNGHKSTNNGSTKKKEKNTSTSKGGYTAKFKYNDEDSKLKKSRSFADREIAKEAGQRAKLAKLKLKYEREEELRKVKAQRERSKTDLAAAKAERRATEKEATSQRYKKLAGYAMPLASLKKDKKKTKKKAHKKMRW